MGTFHHLGVGAAEQFTHWDSLALWAGTIAATTTLVLTEDAFQEDIEGAALLGDTALEVADIGGIVTTIPSIPIGAYVVGRLIDDDHLSQFAVELAAAQGIAMVETLILSQIPVHERPVVQRGEVSDEDQAFFNRFFRGRSSLPSGHVTGLAVLTFKGWEWYGWKLGVPAAIATVFVGYARIEEGQHYTSDIFSGIALAGLASLGTTRSREIWQAYLPSGVLITPVAYPDGGGLSVAGDF